MHTVPLSLEDPSPMPVPPTTDQSPSPTPAPLRDPRGPGLVDAARALRDRIESGQTLSRHSLRATLDRHCTGPERWQWKDAYDASEAAVVLFLKRHGRAMLGAAESPRGMLSMIERLAALEPSHTRRSEEQIARQQFSTPLALAMIAAHAARLEPHDRVLEPSAGTGTLAVFAECVVRSQEQLVLNELAQGRAAMLAGLFPGAAVTQYDAESIEARIGPAAAPTVVLMNPPFSRGAATRRRRLGTDLRHLRSAFRSLVPGGRLVAVTSRGCAPDTEDWEEAFADLPHTVVLSLAVQGRVYARRGTTIETRLTVLDRAPPGARARPGRVDPDELALDAPALLEGVCERLTERRPLEPLPVPIPLNLFGAEPPRPPDPTRRRSARAARDETPPHDFGPCAELDHEPREPTGHSTTGPYEPWEPTVAHVAAAVRHPTALCQSSAMADVAHRPSTFRPLLPERVVTAGMLSDAQLESVVLAGAAHAEHIKGRYRVAADWETVHRLAEDDPGDALPQGADPDERYGAPVEFRKGWMLGDGTGAGKGREVAAIMVDSWLRGRRRALWLSQSDKLIEDARRDWHAVGGRDEQIIALNRIRQADAIPDRDAILFATYATLRSPARQGKPPRIEQVVGWLAGSLDEAERNAFDGVIIFDEAHAMANAAGSKGSRGDVKPSQQGRAGLRLQNALPNARICYVSATGATTVQGLAYARRLGLWACDDTPFETRDAFIQAMELGGVAAMEVVARDLKALGLYQARALSYDGVEIEILEHTLTDEQRHTYDSYAGAFQIIHHNIGEALKASSIVQDGKTLNANAKSTAMSAFESAKQRFFGHLLTSMKCPSLLAAIEHDIDQGRAPVVQLVSTGEALMERRLARIPAGEWEDLTIDLTPREYVIDFLYHAFPIQQHQPWEDEDGNLQSRPMVDEDGRMVVCPEALARRDQLIERLGSLPPVASALDQIIHRFGDDAAEITGRARRIVRLTDDAGERLAVRRRPPSANVSEANAFLAGERSVLVFSMAGGIGRSYHADRSIPNTKRRVHYLLETGWRADQAIQGLGRTHRTHQASAPLFRPVSTDVKGERRFISTIARRLDSLGAITRGQRDSQTAMAGEGSTLFRPEDNLESPYARAALVQLYHAVFAERIDGWPATHFEEMTGLKISYEGALKEILPPMPTFLNRLLALRIDQQNELFAELEVRTQAGIASAVEAGTYEVGVEQVRADSIAISSTDVLAVHPGSGALTELAEVQVRTRFSALQPEDALAYLGPDATPTEERWLAVNDRSGRGAVITPTTSAIDKQGAVLARVRLHRPASRAPMLASDLPTSHWRRTDEREWRAAWDEELASLPEWTESRFWMVSGLLLPLWDRLPYESMRVRRLETDDGRRLIGRILDATTTQTIRNAFGLDAIQLTAREVMAQLNGRSRSITLSNGWTVRTRRQMDAPVIQINGPRYGDTDMLKRLGVDVEVVDWVTNYWVPNDTVLERLLARWPAGAGPQP